MSNSYAANEINVNGIGILGHTATIDSICIDVTHSWVSDVKLRLVSPSQSSIVLTAFHGGSGDNYENTCFKSNSGLLPISQGTAPFLGTYAPEQGLDLFDAEDANGVWKLESCDSIPNSIGTLNSWNISFSKMSSVHEPASRTNSDVSIIPNPITRNSFVQIYLDNPSECSLILFNTQGCKVWMKDYDLNTGLNELPLSLNNVRIHNTYYLTIKTKETNYVKKIFLAYD